MQVHWRNGVNFQEVDCFDSKKFFCMIHIRYLWITKNFASHFVFMLIHFGISPVDFLLLGLCQKCVEVLYYLLFFFQRHYEPTLPQGQTMRSFNHRISTDIWSRRSSNFSGKFVYLKTETHVWNPSLNVFVFHFALQILVLANTGAQSLVSWKQTLICV